MPLKRLPLLAPALLLSACVSFAPAPVPIYDEAAPGGTVGAADPRAAEAGMAMLRQGGSATDAAIATMLALGVVEPQSSGIGGGGFFVRGTADGQVTSLDGRETAPASASPDWFLDTGGQPQSYQQVVRTGLSVGVPGNIALAAEAFERHGTLDWATLFQPAIALARDGFVMNERLHQSLTGNLDRAGMTQEGRMLYYGADGEPLPVGTRIANPALAEALGRIARDGPKAFYRGPVAGAIAQTTAAATPRPGAITVSDLEEFAAKERPPVCGMYRAYRICGMGPPSSGGVAVLQMLGQLERFDLAGMGPRNLQFWHVFVESQRLAYADRELYLADDDYLAVPTRGLIEPGYVARRSQLIDPDRAASQVVAGRPAGAPIAIADGDEPPENGTSHFVAIDDAGTMVSYTSTIEGGFGSGLMVSGFYLNNELTDFSFSPRVAGRPVANRVEGGKRPRSSMAPTVIYAPDGTPFMAIGAAGGATIPVQTARSIIGVIDFGLSLKDALGLPLAMMFGDTLVVEEGSWLADEIAGLEARGYAKVRAASPPFRAVGAVRQDDEWMAAHDPRLDGVLDTPLGGP